MVYEKEGKWLDRNLMAVVEKRIVKKYNKHSEAENSVKEKEES